MEKPSELRDIDTRISIRLRMLRSRNGWSLDHLAELSGVSRASLSRLENGEVSATASVLGKLCSAYGLTLSRLMNMVENEYTPVTRRSEQQVWQDPEKGFFRRQVSPPAQLLAGEVAEVTLSAGTEITYDSPPRPGLEHHLVMLVGSLLVRIEERRYRLSVGDCLRYRLNGASGFSTAQGACYLLFMV